MANKERKAVSAYCGDHEGLKAVRAFETPCLICGERVPVSAYDYSPKICEKCKAAVMKVRERDGK